MQVPEEGNYLVRQYAVAGVVGVQAVGNVFLLNHRNAGLHAAGGEQIKHRQGVPFRYLADDVGVELQVTHVCRLVAVAAGVVFVAAVQGREDDDLRRGVFLDQAGVQLVQAAVEGVFRTVVRRADGRIAVAEIVRAAKDHDDIGVRIHLCHTAGEVQVEAGVIHRGMVLACDASAADAIIAADAAAVRSDQVNIAAFGTAGAHTLGNAVAKKIDFHALQIHMHFHLFSKIMVLYPL